MNEIVGSRPSRAPRSRICSITRPLCSILGGSTNGLTLLTDDAAYYVPPNDKPDADARLHACSPLPTTSCGCESASSA